MNGKKKNPLFSREKGVLFNPIKEKTIPLLFQRK